MKAPIFITLLVLVLVACEKPERETEVPSTSALSFIDTTIQLRDTLSYSLGSFGDEEAARIIRQPRNTNYAGIHFQTSGERILFYIPNDGFLGIDSLQVET